MMTIKNLYESRSWAIRTPKGNLTNKGEKVNIKNCHPENLFKAKEVYEQIYAKGGSRINGYGIVFYPMPEYGTAVMEIKNSVEKEGRINTWASAILAKSKAYAEKGKTKIYVYGTIKNIIPEMSDKDIKIYTGNYYTIHTSINIGESKEIPDLMPLIEFINTNYVDKSLRRKYAEGISKETLIEYIKKTYEKYPMEMEEALKKTWENE